MNTKPNMFYETEDVVQAPDTANPITILLIEDSNADAKLFASTLKGAEDAERYWLVHVKRLAKGCKLIARDHFDIVVLDLTLPDSSGLDSVTAIRELAPDLPIVVLTGMKNDRITHAAIKAGAQDYIVKGSAASDELSKSLKFAIERHRTATERELLVGLNDEVEFDHATNLPGPKLFGHLLEQGIAQARHSAKSLAVLNLRIENLEDLAQKFGTDAETMLLRVTIERIRGSIRENDIIGRVGPFDLDIILQDLDKPLEIASVAKRILEIVTIDIPCENRRFSLQTHIGIALYGVDGLRSDELLQNSKLASERCAPERPIRFFSEECNFRTEENKKSEEELLKAIEKNELSVHYQPQIDIRSSSLVGLHALLRWQHPEHGFLVAQDFIIQADRAKVIGQLNQYLLKCVCRQLNEWNKIVSKPVQISLNVTGAELRSDTFAKDVEKVLKETETPPQLIAFQFKESATLKNWPVVLRNLGELKKLGVKLILDNVGALDALLASLKTMPIDQINISARCIHNMILDSKEQASFDCLVTIAHRFNIPILAKGVESEEQLNLIQLSECDYAEGFFLCDILVGDEIDLVVTRQLVYEPLPFLLH